jgi:Sec-independent protein secretion pathway component TatC
MGILREILKMAIFIPSVVWFIFALMSDNGRSRAIEFNMCVSLGLFVAGSVICHFVLKPSFLEFPSNDGQGQGSKEGQANE